MIDRSWRCKRCPVKENWNHTSVMDLWSVERKEQGMADGRYFGLSFQWFTLLHSVTGFLAGCVVIAYWWPWMLCSPLWTDCDQFLTTEKWISIIFIHHRATCLKIMWKLECNEADSKNEMILKQFLPLPVGSICSHGRSQFKKTTTWFSAGLCLSLSSNYHHSVTVPSPERIMFGCRVLLLLRLLSQVTVQHSLFT